MGRIFLLAVVLAVAAGGVTVAAGGVKLKKDHHSHKGPPPFPAAQPAPRATRAGGPTITMRRLAFSRGTVTVHVGQAVTWKNKDEVVHTVTATDDLGGAASFDSGRLKPGADFRFVARTPGRFAYICEIHPTVMRGVVVVTR